MRSGDDGGDTSSNGAHFTTSKPSRTARSAAAAKSDGARAEPRSARLTLAYSGILAAFSPPSSRRRLTHLLAARVSTMADRSALTAAASARSSAIRALSRPSAASGVISSNPSRSESADTSSASNEAARAVSAPQVSSTTAVAPSASRNSANVHSECGVALAAANVSPSNIGYPAIVALLVVDCAARTMRGPGGEYSTAYAPVGMAFRRVVHSNSRMRVDGGTAWTA